MIAACAYHLMYLLVSRPFSTAMLPKFSDIGDFIQDMKHTFRLSKEAPQFDRYSYRNKAAYWLVYPGATIMIATGLMLLYPTQITAQRRRLDASVGSDDPQRRGRFGGAAGSCASTCTSPTSPGTPSRSTSPSSPAGCLSSGTRKSSPWNTPGS